MYHCPYCDSTNLRKFIFTYKCAKVNKKCPFERQDGKRAEELPLAERKGACELCDYKGEAIMSYKCVDCDKTFLCPVEDLNETPRTEEKNNNQIVFTLRKDSSDDKKHNDGTNE